MCSKKLLFYFFRFFAAVNLENLAEAKIDHDACVYRSEPHIDAEMTSYLDWHCGIAMNGVRFRLLFFLFAVLLTQTSCGF